MTDMPGTLCIIIMWILRQVPTSFDVQITLYNINIADLLEAYAVPSYLKLHYTHNRHSLDIGSTLYIYYSWMYGMLDFICMGFVELWGTGSTWAIHHENIYICPQRYSNQPSSAPKAAAFYLSATLTDDMRLKMTLFTVSFCVQHASKHSQCDNVYCYMLLWFICHDRRRLLTRLTSFQCCWAV